LERRGQKQRHGERRESEPDGAIEAVGFIVDFGRIARYPIR
jgi:hypothetical protein